MKKKLLLVLLAVALFVCAFALTAAAEDKIIKFSYAPTLAEIHANPEAYVSHLDAFDGNSYGELDSASVVVLSDLAETPTYYVFPSYYYIQSTSNHVYHQLPKLNAAISEADSTAFAGYAAIDNSWCGGSCKYLIRFEVPTYVTTIAATAKFESSSNLLEVYFPTKTVIDDETGLEKTVTYVTSVSGQNLFTSCTKLEYIHNMEYLPVGIVQGNNDGFASCNALKEIKIPYGVTSIPGTCFKNCWAVKEIVLPNTVTTTGKGAFSTCRALESFTFSANFTTFSSSNVDYETFANCNNLKYIYIPAGVLGTLEKKANNYKSIFGISSKAIYFLVGDEEDAIRIKDWFQYTNANTNIGNADIAAYDPSIDYQSYQTTLTKSVIVYGYSACEAFYGGAHNVSDKYSWEYTGEMFLSKAIKSKACANCTFKVDASEIMPLFASLGYSSNGNGSVVQGFSVSFTAIDSYASVLGEISYGVVAAGDTRADKTQGVDVFSLDKYLAQDLSGRPYDLFDVKVSGFTEDDYDKSIFFCAYVIAGEKTYYINDGVVGTTATSITYNEIVG